MLVLGDLNENLLKYNEDKQTSEYLDMFLTLGFEPIITKPTRITDHTAILIDHIYTNVPEKLKAGFHMIADRRSQIAESSTIVCDHMETHFCDRLRSSAILRS